MSDVSVVQFCLDTPMKAMFALGVPKINPMLLNLAGT